MKSDKKIKNQKKDKCQLKVNFNTSIFTLKPFPSNSLTISTRRPRKSMSNTFLGNA